ncbi:sensor histidine kinase [Gracilimonas sp. BCB1]|uniref:sensor histidine kinase n=1 Tax=Gracilimonas sp. BCB1 TaxID=3152362 RepID=UPI0032D8F4A5
MFRQSEQDQSNMMMMTLRQEICTPDLEAKPVNAFKQIDGYHYTTSEYTLMQIIKDLFNGYPHPIMVLHRNNREICYVSHSSSEADSLLGQNFDKAITFVDHEVSREPVARFNNRWLEFEERLFSWEQEKYTLVVFKQRNEIPEEKTLVSWKNMIAVMLHRFRSPLTGISGYVDMLSEHNNDARQDKYFNLVNKGLDHLYDMMDELEILYTIDSDQTEVELTSFKANKLFQSILLDYPTDVQERIDMSSIDFDMELHGNPASLKKIIELLIQNGLDHGPDHAVTISVPSEKLIQISNPGPAIPESISKNLFSPFVTDKANGLGIGLTLALLYAHQLGGTIFLSKNDEVEGITFSLCLPE